MAACLILNLLLILRKKKYARDCNSLKLVCNWTDAVRFSFIPCLIAKRFEKKIVPMNKRHCVPAIAKYALRFRNLPVKCAWFLRINKQLIFFNFKNYVSRFNCRGIIRYFGKF